jgi:saccharopine dehydrogenase-like NADP-dependent oxidoreductase
MNMKNKMHNIILLGAGRMAQAIVYDLSRDYEITVADINENALHEIGAKFKVPTIVIDSANKPALQKAIKPFHLVIGAVPGFIGFQMMEAVLEAGKPIIDISFFDEDVFLLDDLAKSNKVMAIPDIGVAPGMSNLILGYHAANMEVEHFHCMVGGLPVERKRPFEYKAPFSPIDVIEEYIRPSRMMVNGAIVEKPALTEPEFFDFDQIGTLEAFNTDGLRSLLKTMQVPDMIEKTLRYPGHRQLMQDLRDAGFFSKETKQVEGVAIRPIDLTAGLLFKQWALQPDEDEFTVMRVTVTGKESGESVRYEYNLLDYRDKQTGLSSMARTTGFTCSSAVRMCLNGLFNETGIQPPEYVGRNEACFRFILRHLSTLGVQWKSQKTML